MIIDKYQEEPPSNQQWTAGDDHPDIGSTDDWNVVPLERNELSDFKKLLDAQAMASKHPSVFAFRMLSQQKALMKAYHTRWTSNEWTSDCEI